MKKGKEMFREENKPDTIEEPRTQTEEHPEEHPEEEYEKETVPLVEIEEEEANISASSSKRQGQFAGA